MSREEEIFELYKEIKLIQAKIDNLKLDDSELYNKYVRDIFELKVKLRKLEKDLYLYKNPDLSNDEIDLYLKNYHDLLEEAPDTYKYIITKHGTKDKIGEFEVRFSLLKKEKSLGNMGAYIESEYRGMRYAQKTFVLLRNVLLEKGLSKPIFTVREDNLSSIKSLDNMGAKRIGAESDEDGLYYIYEYDLLNDRDKGNHIK